MSFLLGEDAMRELRMIARKVLREELVKHRLTQSRPRETGNDIWLVKTSTGGITARSSDTPGTGTGQLFYLGSTGDLTAGSTVTRTIYSCSTSTIAGSKYIHVEQDNAGTLWALTSAAAAGTKPRLGKPDATIADGATGTVSIWERQPTLQATTVNETCLNETGLTLAANVFVTVTDVDDFDTPVISPYELEACT